MSRPACHRCERARADEFTRGFAVAAKFVAEQEGDSFAVDMLRSHGFTLASLRAAGVPASDIEPFRKEMKRREARLSSPPEPVRAGEETKGGAA